jgi:hypothetical protein
LVIAGLIATGCFNVNDFVSVKKQSQAASNDGSPANPATPGSVPAPPVPPELAPGQSILGIRGPDASVGPLKQSHGALQAHHNEHSQFPLAGDESPDSQQKLSWRVMVLPYLDAGLYQQINREQAWNSEANARYHTHMPAAYRSPNWATNEPKTVILAPVTPRQSRGNTVLQVEPLNEDIGYGGKRVPRAKPRASNLTDVTDGTSNTVLLVEADASVAAQWMQPTDLAFDPANPKRGLGNLVPGGFCAVFVNGAVRFISNKVDDQVVAAMMRRDEREQIGLSNNTKLVAP